MFGSENTSVEGKGKGIEEQKTSDLFKITKFAKELIRK